MNIWRRLKAAWAFWKIEPYLDVPQWLQGDAEELSHFLTQKEAGRKLSVLLSNRVSQTARQATLKFSTPYDSGYAGGCRGTTAFIDSLLIISPLSSESTEQTDEIENQDAHSIERYRP